MKYATYRHEGEIRVGQVSPDGLSVTPVRVAGRPVSDLHDVFAGAAGASGAPVALASVELLAPIPRPRRNLFCVGKNYAAHAKEFAGSGFDAGHTGAPEDLPTDPIVFTKAPECVIGHGAAIWAAEGVTDFLDYEAELAVIIGVGGRGITRAEAMRHVWGYTIINDVTARDWQKRHKQWFMGKSFDTFAPMGPFAVTADAIDGASLDLSCWVNGERRQHANTRDLIFDIPTLIETISAGITLMPGDIIATGTPEGVGIGRKPPTALRRGDLIEIEIAGIGRLGNRVG
ncbi:hydrolase [Luteibacter rhizovicinus DSM 16549]|uniref:Hydrolase n=1 Tax=Luteibacter rhizovicinus DSM 16549 TaxID=1440763 RepID=A0A0G9H7W1_9GAMM|nr:fumarylacetoacetate hydrolase family protein [Luteibacter rhizovicinus]APG06242.1 hydrolase [Luteibacter rhizovicinus DSM 16549]KLD65663.1 hydrolase [Luteibacter rhizovicinus DSM 16549]KLD75596.1 hydrolase [Xanthomonas hyacinthi DSM 19077]